MGALSAYSIPIQGLKIGIHRYKFFLDQEFYRHFEEAPIQVAAIHCGLQLDKRADMLVLDFALSGVIDAECDRCTAAIQLPLSMEKQLLVKYGDQEGETEDEVVFIHRESPFFDVSKYLYEFSVLALPIANVYDCEQEANPPCNFEVLDFLQKEEKEEDKDEGAGNPFREILKDFNKN